MIREGTCSQCNIDGILRATRRAVPQKLFGFAATVRPDKCAYFSVHQSAHLVNEYVQPRMIVKYTFNALLVWRFELRIIGI